MGNFQLKRLKNGFVVDMGMCYENDMVFEQREGESLEETHERAIKVLTDAAREKIAKEIAKSA